ncbi:MAG: pilus assembly protein PilY, partial [Rhizobacter sp.]|nr:pilus assembly protein PilY [Rhizobacter sp.]
MPTAHRFTLIAALLTSAPLAALAAPPFALASYPLFLAPGIQPNVMIILDNSESMDGTMAGKVINGDDPTTRGNIARGVLRGILTSYRGSFNFGITSFNAYGPSLYNTHAYYLGTDQTMVYTNDCVGGISPSNNNLRCIANPEPGNGYGYITYERSGDDADINDVLYSYAGDNQLYGMGVYGTSYYVFNSHANTTGWGWPDFGGFYGQWDFTPTDAGFLPTVAATPRQLWIRRGWGYGDYITGGGIVNEPVAPDSTTHFSRLTTLLGSETPWWSGEIKNNAFFTPIAGTLATVRDYFGQGGSTPITQSCQKNFVMLATDGNPTGRTDGSQYDPSQWQNTYDAASSTWTFGQAQQDVFAQLTALRSTQLGGKTYDIQTYVVGMGDTVANPSSIATLNQMAALGGGYPTAFLGSSADALQHAFQSIVADIQAKTAAASSVALNTGSWTTGSAIYQAKFNSGDWSGTLLDYPISANGSVASNPAWDAGVQLKGQNWNAGRNIITYKPSAAAGLHGIPLRWPINAASPGSTELDASQVAALNLTPGGGSDGFGELRLRYLRGDATQESRSCASPPCAAPQFRNRNTSPLGDIVNSSPYFVAAPNFGYYDDFESARYSSFANTYRGRTPVIYFGANDGMLHAINANTGVELFAYVPSAVYSNLSTLTDIAYVHQYFVDGSPTVGDVFYGGAWHSLL